MSGNVCSWLPTRLRSVIYEDQLPSAVTRTSLLYAHPEDGKPVTVVSTQGNLLLEYQQKWLDLLGEWYEVHGEQVVLEQKDFETRSAQIN